MHIHGRRNIVRPCGRFSAELNRLAWHYWVRRRGLLTRLPLLRRLDLLGAVDRLPECLSAARY